MLEHLLLFNYTQTKRTRNIVKNEDLEFGPFCMAGWLIDQVTPDHHKFESPQKIFKPGVIFAAVLPGCFRNNLRKMCWYCDPCHYKRRLSTKLWWFIDDLMLLWSPSQLILRLRLFLKWFACMAHSCFPSSSPGFKSQIWWDFSLYCLVCEQYWDQTIEIVVYT